MRVTIRDPEILRAISPMEVAAYLRTRGWHEVRVVSRKGSYWIWKDIEGHEFEVALPLDRNLGDYLHRMGDLLGTLEESEDRSQFDILRDLTETAADVVRIPANYAEAADGSMPFEDGVAFFGHARDLMLAAACSSVRRQGAFHTRKPGQAVQYVRSVRLGQTEPGSYTLCILSRVPPALKGTDGLILSVDDPFERQVTDTLARALTATELAAQRSAATGKFDDFRDAVNVGVSANLCEAIVGLSRFAAPSKGLAFDFSWARNRPTPQKTPGRITLPVDAVPVIQEAGRVLRATSPQEDFFLYGPVVRLERESDGIPGRIIVLAFVDGTTRKVSVVLAPDDYVQAIQAHEKSIPITCEGDLLKEGRSYILSNPHHFRFESDSNGEFETDA